MASIAISFSGDLDTSNTTIEDTTYIKSLRYKGSVDTSFSIIEDINYIRSLHYTSNLETSKPQVSTSICIAVPFESYLETAYTTVETNKIHKASIEGNLETSTIELNTSVVSPLNFKGYLETSNLLVETNSLNSLSFNSNLDNSTAKITEVTRSLLGEPPFGELKVDVRGVDVPLNGFSLLKNGTYPINIWLYWDRLSIEGTELVFTIKQTTNPDQLPYTSRNSKGNGITIIRLQPHGTTGLDELKAQIVLRPEDMVGLPNKSTKLYYELLLKDSLNEDYIIERGSFTVNPSV